MALQEQWGEFEMTITVKDAVEGMFSYYRAVRKERRSKGRVSGPAGTAGRV